MKFALGQAVPRADEVCAFEMDANPVPTKTNP